MIRGRKIADQLISNHTSDGGMVQYFGEEQEFQVVSVHCTQSHQLEENFAETKCFVGKAVLAVTLHGREDNFLACFCVW